MLSFIFCYFLKDFEIGNFFVRSGDFRVEVLIAAAFIREISSFVPCNLSIFVILVIFWIPLNQCYTVQSRITFNLLSFKLMNRSGHHPFKLFI